MPIALPWMHCNHAVFYIFLEPRITLYKVCAVQAKAHLRYRLRVCSRSWGMYNNEFPSACTAHPQHVLHTSSLYCTPSACTAHPQPVLHTLSLYCTPSTCTAHPQPVLHTLSLYCTPSACIAHPQPVLHTLSLCCTPSACTAHTLCRVENGT